VRTAYTDGHSHRQQQEASIVTDRSGRIRLDDELRPMRRVEPRRVLYDDVVDRANRSKTVPLACAA
jgi:hypothetical protein